MFGLCCTSNLEGMMKVVECELGYPHWNVGDDLGLKAAGELGLKAELH